MKKEFKARASKCGVLFTNPRNKSETISETTKTYIEEWMIEEMFGVRKEISSKYLDKGLQLEDQAILEYNKLFGVSCIKNDEWFEDDFVTGTPDIIIPELNKIVDIKCSYSPFTFPMFEKELPNKLYMYQLQAYMRLTGCDNAEIAYFLLSTPEDIILREAKSIMYKEQLGDDFLDVVIEEVREAHNFDHIPICDRVKIFKVDRDDDIINDIEVRVSNCREYIKSLSK